MKKKAIIYCSYHHLNTKKLVDSIENVDLFNVKDLKDINFEVYDLLGFASGIYAFQMSNKILEIAKNIDIFFADPGRPSQRGLNENSNGLLRRDGLPKQTDFNEMDESFIQSVASFRNHIPRKSLNYKTPVEVLVENIYGKLSNLY